MAVFSNLEGTMKKSFILGKNGAKISFENSSLKIYNYQGTSLLPISAGEPTDNTHLVTLSYFNSHAGGGGSGALSGTTDPDSNLGQNGDVYYKVDSTSILAIYFKDAGIWKGLASSSGDTSYVTSTHVTPTDFVQSGLTYVYSLPASTHGRGSAIIVQIQSTLGEVQDNDVQVDSSGNITITLNALPTESFNVLIIGETHLSSPFQKLIDKSSWTASGSEFTISIPQTEHDQVAGSIFISTYENTVDSATSQSPYALVSVQTAIDNSGNIILTSNTLFSGLVVISGK